MSLTPAYSEAAPPAASLSPRADLRGTLVVLLVWLALELLYRLVAPAVITALYDRTLPITWAHQLIANPEVRPLAGYLRHAEALYTTAVRATAIAVLLGLFVVQAVVPAIRGRPAMRSPGLPLCAAIGFVALAWMLRFIQDDAFISFVYADRLARGLGPTWSDGARIEGYTNFLWMLMVAGGIRCGLDPILWSWAMGLALFAGSLALTWHLASRVAGNTATAALATLILGANYTFLAYATGGLETQLQAFLILAVACCVLQMTNSVHPLRWAVMASLSGAACMMTRLDSALPMLVLFGAAAASLRANPRAIAACLRLLVALSLPGVLAVGAWLLWKLAYYGSVLPNTFNAKIVGAKPPLAFGLGYVSSFLSAYWLWPLLLLPLLACWPAARRRLGLLWLAVVTVFIWLTYIVWVGGDFMEFRFMVPVLPLVAILTASLILAASARPVVRALLLALLVGASIHHALRFRHNHIGVDDIRTLNHFITWDYISYRDIGASLREHLSEDDPSLLVATTSVGAIGYYSRLPVFDMFGLNDRDVALNGRRIGRRPGHQRLATGAQMRARNVNLVIGMPFTRPWIRGNAELPAEGAAYVLGLMDGAALPPGARIVEMPMNARFAVTMLALHPSPAIDAAIRRGAIRAYPVSAFASPRPSP